MALNYLTLQQAKQHLNIESAFTDDDAYITSLCEVAEQMVEEDVNDSLSGITASFGGSLPTPLKQAMLLVVGNFYQNREILGIGKVAALPYNYNYLIDFYRNYNK